MIMIIAIIYIFLSYVILINSWKLLSENPQAPLKKSTPPYKNSKSACPPPLFANIENSSDPLLKEGRGHYADVEYPSRKAKKNDVWRFSMKCVITLLLLASLTSYL